MVIDSIFVNMPNVGMTPNMMICKALSVSEAPGNRCANSPGTAMSGPLELLDSCVKSDRSIVMSLDGVSRSLNRGV